MADASAIRFLQQNPVGNLRGRELRRYLARLAECNPLFAEYRQEGSCGQKGGTENSGSGQNRAGQGTSSFAEFGAGQKCRDVSAAPNAYYRIFGLTPETLTEGSLKAAYRDLVKKYHPDTNRSPDAAEKFRKVKKSVCLSSGRASPQGVQQELCLLIIGRLPSAGCTTPKKRRSHKGTASFVLE